jgi:hypothetical protein
MAAASNPLDRGKGLLFPTAQIPFKIGGGANQAVLPATGRTEKLGTRTQSTSGPVRYPIPRRSPAPPSDGAPGEAPTKCHHLEFPTHAGSSRRGSSRILYLMGLCRKPQRRKQVRNTTTARKKRSSAGASSISSDSSESSESVPPY